MPTQENQSSNNTMYFQFIFCEISCFCCNVVEALALLWCYTAYVGSCLLTFGTDHWSHLMSPLRMGPAGLLETVKITTNIHCMKSQKNECLSIIYNKIANKMRQCIRIYYLMFIWSSTCFRRHTAHHQEHNCTSSVWFCIRTLSSNHSVQQPFRMQNQRLLVQLCSWWWAVCRPKHVELHINIK